MKRTIQLRHGRVTANHEVEIGPQDVDSPSHVQGEIDGQQVSLDCVRIAPGVYSVILEGRSYEVRVAIGSEEVSGDMRIVTIGARDFHVEVRDPRRRTSHRLASESGPKEIQAPMPGKVVKLLVEEGQEAVENQGLLVIEAMKMQNEIRAPRTGRVAKIHVKEGAGVESGAKLLLLE